MNSTPKQTILNSTRLPARLSSEDAAVVLGYEPHDLPTLIAAGLLKPLGAPTKNAPKRFAAIEILAKTEDLKWLVRAEIAIAQKWKSKNARRPKGGE